MAKTWKYVVHVVLLHVVDFYTLLCRCNFPLFQVATACAELQSSHCMLHIYCIYFTIIMALDTVNDGV